MLLSDFLSAEKPNTPVFFALTKTPPGVGAMEELFGASARRVFRCSRGPAPFTLLKFAGMSGDKARFYHPGKCHAVSAVARGPAWLARRAGSDAALAQLVRAEEGAWGAPPAAGGAASAADREGAAQSRLLENLARGRQIEKALAGRAAEAQEPAEFATGHLFFRVADAPTIARMDGLLARRDYAHPFWRFGQDAAKDHPHGPAPDTCPQRPRVRDEVVVPAEKDRHVILRGETKGSTTIWGKMGIRVAGFGGQNEHQLEPGSHEISCSEGWERPDLRSSGIT